MANTFRFLLFTQVSFFKLIESLEKQANDTDENVAAFAKNLLKECAKHPKIKEGLSIEEFDKDHPVIKKLCWLLFPDVLLTNEIKGLIPPFEFKTFHESTRLKNILQNAGDDFSFDLNGFLEDQLYIYGCATILTMHYGFPLKPGLPSMVDIPDKQHGVNKPYRLAMNGEMMEIIPTDKAVSISKDDYLNLLDNFSDNNTLKTEVDDYFQILNPDLHSIYEQRKNYDDSVNQINQSLAAYLDERQIEAQTIFPHYFERYKTDGVEYNMYIGQSIANRLEFSELFLHNLQLWQLMVTCDLELKFASLKKKLKSDIEIASLILVYGTPLAVHFRMDEKRFDVEGAYNARYEIVKKRIDKAPIKGTKERITTPGKIAIIFSNEHEAVTYGRYISFLESKGYLQKNSKEVVQVEDLQGISGLKALRVNINYNNKAPGKTYTVNEILEPFQN